MEVIPKMKVSDLSSDELQLLQCYRDSDEHGKNTIILLAQSEALHSVISATNEAIHKRS